MPLFDRPGAVLCGSFLGAGNRAMVVSFAAATCGGSSGWAAFRRSHGDWSLAWHYRNGQASIVAVGDELKETLNILKPTDPRCVPTGGTKFRLWHWTGGRFVPGSWTYHYVNPEMFSSPGGHVTCYIGSEYDGAALASCYGSAAKGRGPQVSARIEASGKIYLCNVATPSLSEVCFQNWDPELPVLEYGQYSELDGVRCTSAADGITCINVSGSGKGHGFRVAKDEAVEVPVAPILDVGAAGGKRNASHAQLWSALGGKVTCGLAIRSPSSPNLALCASRSIPPPRNTSDTEGDPGFVYLKQHGGPDLARLSQYSWERGWRYKESTTPTPLPAGTTWTLPGGGVRCQIRQTSVRCRNRDGRGFLLKPTSYRKTG